MKAHNIVYGRGIDMMNVAYQIQRRDEYDART
jgi:hypothetical protein